MTTVVRLYKRAGRFGREIRDDRAQAADARTPTHADGCDTVDYEVDANAVAGAMLERLFAGGALPHPAREQR
jgi:hypothetical protein